MPENNLKIGATVDVGAINEGMANVAEITKAATRNIAISFEEASTKTKNAMRNLSDDVKQAADSVSRESIRVAEATREQSEAFADLRRATVLTRDSQVDASLAAKLLAAAQDKAMAATAERAEAQRAAASAARAAAAEEALSANFIARSFQLASLSVRESIGEMQEKLVQFAEESKVAGGGITAGFGAFGALLGAGIAVQFFGQFLDETAKTNLELSHLHEKTNIAVADLAGLRQIAKESGVEFEGIGTGLVRMVRAQELVKEGNEAMAKGFERLGVSEQQVKDSSPEALLQLLATRFAATGDAGKLAASAIQIFGRGGALLIPILRQQGDALTETMAKTAKLTGVTDESVAASVRWIRNMAIFSAEMQKFGNFAIENAHYVLGAFDAIGLGIQAVLETVVAGLVSAGHGLVGITRLIGDVMTGNYGAIIADAQGAAKNVSSDWKKAFGDIRSGWDEVNSHFKSQPAPKLEAPGAVGDDDGGDTGKAPKKGRDLAFQHDEEELNERRIATAKAGNQFLLAEEVHFWEGKLAAAHKGSDEYRQILARLAPLEEKMAKSKGPEKIKLIDADISGQVAEFEAANNAMVKENEEAQRQMLAAFRSAREEEIRLQDEKYRELEQDTQFEVSQSRMTAQERLSILRTAANQEFEVKKSAVMAMEAVDMNDAAKYQQDLNRELEITRQHNRQIVLLNQQTATQSEKAWQQAYQKMTTEFNRNVAEWITTQRGFAQSMAQMVNSIAQNFIQNLLKMTEQEIMASLEHKALMKQDIIADAHAAASGAAKWANNWGGPVAGAVAGAAAFAGVLAFESFNEGGVVMQGNGAHVPILAKQGERVLTPTQNSNFESLVNNRSSSQSSTVNARVTQNFPNAKAGSSARETQSAVKSLMRRGKLGYS